MHDWFKKYSWLHYNETEDMAYCFVCIKSLKENLRTTQDTSSAAFTHQGFDFWNKAVERFKMHEESKEHKDSNFLLLEGPKYETVDKQYDSVRAVKRKCFMKMLQNLQFLAMSNIAILGHEKDTSNVLRLGYLRAKDDLDLVSWLDKECGNYVCSQIQNELLDLMGQRIKNEHLLKHIQKSKFFTLMCDETTNISNQG